MKLLITGGAGFIGSHVVRRFVLNYPGYEICNLDALTYAGNLENLKDIEKSSSYTFVKGNIIDEKLLEQLFDTYRFDGVIHLAAESHVDRSIRDSSGFLETNIQGTVALLNAAKRSWEGEFGGKLFYHISTDEVFGSLGPHGTFTEESPYAPNSPYAASKASSDHFVKAYGTTYGLPFVITNCSNNYGPNQFPEKLIPLFINNIVRNKPLPLYGDGRNIRDWLYVEDHARAIDRLFHAGRRGQSYCIGGGNEWTNIDLARMLCRIADRKLDREAGSSEKLITFVKDRPGHDLRYAIDSAKIQGELGWGPSMDFTDGLEHTFSWYLENSTWLEHITSGSYRDYYTEMYEKEGPTQNKHL